MDIAMALFSDSGSPRELPRFQYLLGPNDLDWRGTGKTVDEALDEAFRRTEVSRDEFEVTKWGKDRYGKSHPVEWEVLEGPNKGAKVNIDWPHNWSHGPSGPDAPHVGWESPGKRRRGEGKRGHIIIDEVPYNR